MKKHLLLSVLFCLSFFWAGCNKSDIKPNAVRTNENNTEMANSQKEFIFQENQECLKHKDEITKKLQAKSSDFLGETSLEQIFYSPKANSCLYVEYNHRGDHYGRTLFDVLNDGLSSDPIAVCVSKKIFEKCEEVDKKIEEYKNY